MTMARQPVRINVYDMYWLNDYASNIGVGIFHTGIEVFGVEYAYGGHPFAFSGIFENSPQDAEELGENFKFKESIVIGETDFMQKDIRDLIKALGGDFRGDRYHLISRNCNHFSAQLAKTLTGKEIPGWINRLASISSSIPFLERCLPQEWLTPVALQQSIDDRNGSNGSIDSAEEAKESAAGRGLNDSTMTILNGRTPNGTSIYKNGTTPSSASSGVAYFHHPGVGVGQRLGSSGSSGAVNGTTPAKTPPTTTQSAPNSARPESGSIGRLWNQLKGSMIGPEPKP